MEAKDTVIAGVKFLKIAHDGGLNAAAEAQAEVSFKAGIKEVVDWIIDNNAVPDHILDLWKSALKEWGINEL